MAENYDFLRTFTIDGKKTNHLFQIAKVTIPFLNKENEFYNVGNTDGSHFRVTRLGNYTLQIDGFVIKDNTKMSVSDAMDELKRLCNTDEPKPLVFDVFPDRYFNAIFSGAQEYDATNLDYTPLSLVFEVPDGLAHQINPSGFSNVYTSGTNLMLDSEFNNTKKYMASWVQVLDEKFEGSNIVRADFSNGTPLDEEERNDHWLYKTWVSNRTLSTLKKGVSVGISVYVRINKIDPNNKYAGSLVLEEFTDGKKNGTNHFVRFDNVVNDKFVKYSGTFTLTNEKTNGIAMSLGIYGESASIDYSKPMIGLLPPIGTTVIDSIVGATLYSNSLDFGDYDYSGNPNLMIPLKASDFNSGYHGSITDVDGKLHFTSDGTGTISMFTRVYTSALASGKTYTLSAKVRFDEGTTGDINKLRLVYRTSPNGNILLEANNTTMTVDDVGKEITIKATANVNYQITNFERFYLTVSFTNQGKINGGFKLHDIKIEEGSTATPYQPNLLDEPYYLSKVPLGENLITNGVFPITSFSGPNGAIYFFNISEEIIIGESYTVSLKGTRTPNKEFHIYLGESPNWQATLSPVEGLTDVWSATFKANNSIGTSELRTIALYQKPDSVPDGSVQIDWFKIEKGDTRTPNINYYKYRGLHSYPSNNPKEYAWEYDPSYFNSVNYVASEEGYADVVNVVNNGTYKAYPTFNFTMNGENGLVAVLNEKGNVLQFGNPEDVDGTIATRLDMGLKESFWGNKLPTNLTINSGFDSVVPNFNNNPITPNLVDGSFDMQTYVDAIRPLFPQISKEVWHGPTMLLPITAPTNNDRTGSFGVHTRFYFRNVNKGERGRLEFAVNDETGANAMTFIVRDSSIANTEIVLEMWYKKKKLNQISLDRKVFKKDFFEINMERFGNTLTWRFVQINSLNKYENVVVDKQYKFTWELEENDTTKFTTTGVWFMRYGNTPHNPMYVTDMQAKWYNTPFFNNVKNIFQDGDNVTIDVQERSIYINGTINNELNVVGNEWEQFRLGLGTTIIQPIVSSWAEPANVNVSLRQSYL